MDTNNSFLTFFSVTGLIALLLAGFHNAFKSSLNSLDELELPVFSNENKPESEPMNVLRRLLIKPRRLLMAIIIGRISWQTIAIISGIYLLDPKHFWTPSDNLHPTTKILLISVLYFIAFLISISATVVLSDFMPRAFIDKGRFLPKAAPFMNILMVLGLPFVAVSEWVAYFFCEPDQLLKVYGMSQLDLFRTVDKRQQEEEGLDETEQQMISNIFEFGETTVREIMTPRPDIISIDVEQPIDEIMTIIASATYSRFPVYEDSIDNVIGILHLRDLFTASYASDSNKIDFRSLLQPVHFVPETKPLDELLRELKSKKRHMAIVFDEYGGVAGLVTIEDLLEEIVGEIEDEHDDEALDLYQTDDKSWIVSAKLSVDESNERLDLDIPESGEYDTLGGFVFDRLGRVPKVGDSFEHKDKTITVIAIDGNRIKRLKIN